jgi:putative sterol carrier protein
MTIPETFQLMKDSFNPAAAVGLNKTYQWNITGENGGVYTVKIANQVCELIEGPATEKPDLTVTVSVESWLALTEERLDPMKAFLTGKVKAKGDMTLAMRIPNLFPRK